MADIELVIKLSEQDYELACKYPEVLFGSYARSIKNGTPLPKGHGRIADIDKLLEEMIATRTYDIPFALERVKPIIESEE